MKKLSILCLMAFLTLGAWAQRPAPDAIETSKGPLKIQPIEHATFTMTYNGKTIYADPNGGAKAFEGLAAPDLIVVTDIHGDHFNPETLQAVMTATTILVVPQAVADKLPEPLKAKAVVLANGKSTEQLGIKIAAIPMYNLPETADSKHPKGRGNGYVMTFANKVVYISGDTQGIAEMRALKNVDVAFICMNLPYTMNITEAASAVLEFKPRIVYPYHYRGQNGFADVAGFKKLVNDANPGIDVRLREWYGK